MADLLKKITDLTAGTPLETDVIPYVDLVEGETKKALKSELKGDKGDKGDTGEQGLQGEKGDAGTGATVVTAFGETTSDEKVPSEKLVKDSLDAISSPSKATGAELDTGTDDAKFATAKAIKDSKNVPSVAPGTSGNLLTSDGTDWTSAAPTITATSTTTFTNKRITQRVTSAANYTTDTGTSLNADNCDVFRVTAQEGALLFNEPGGTPTDGQKLIISVASNTTTARALTWNAIFEASTVSLPTTTTDTTAQLNIGFIYSTPRTKWVCVAVS
jgi:hypothetical protein